MRRIFIIAIPLLIVLCIGGLVLINQFAQVFRVRLRSCPGVSMVYQASGASGLPAEATLIASTAGKLQRMIDPEGLTDLSIIAKSPGQLEFVLPDPPADASQPTASDLQDLLSQTGTLEFSIVVTDLAEPASVAMADRLRQSGPAVEADDHMKWVEAVGISGIPVVSWNGTPYLLVHTVPEHSLMHDRSTWQLNRAYPVTTPNGSRGVGFELDEEGGRRFAQLTGSHLGQFLAVVVNNRAISVAKLQSQITRYGILSLDDSSQTNLWKTIRALNAGSLPVRLSPQQISQRPVTAAHYLNLGLQLSYLLLIVIFLLTVTWAILLLLALLARLKRKRTPIPAGV